MWNVNSGEVLQTFKGHTNSVIAIAINPDGQTLASGGKDGIKIWDLNYQISIISNIVRAMKTGFLANG